MKSLFKWLAICCAGLFLLVVIAAVVASQLVDVKKYKPRIEKMVTEATGRSFSMGEEMDVSVFPWIGVTLTDLRLGNPDGYQAPDMVSIKHFEVRLKVMPLLSKKIEVKTFVVDQPEIHLEKQSKDRANWLGIGKAGQKADAGKDDKAASGKGAGSGAASPLPLEGLNVANFAVTKGKMTYIDKVSGTQKKITDITMKLSNVTLETPVGILFQAVVDGQPVSVQGTAGPIGKTPGKGVVNVDFTINALKQIKAAIKGQVTDPASAPGFDFQVAVDPFSPKAVMKAVGAELPITPKDDTVLSDFSFSAGIKGSPSRIMVSGGKMVIDDSTLVFSAEVKEFHRPDVKFDFQLDRIDLDRYLPESQKGDASGKPAAPENSAGAGSAADSNADIDYTPLRKLVMDGRFQVGWLKASGAVMENILAQVSAKNGKIALDPFKADLYKGGINSKTIVDVTKETPATRVDFTLADVQAGPLVQDVMKKELIEGTMNATAGITVTGDAPDQVKKSLSGKGEMTFTDGAIVGIDLANAVRNVQAAVGLAENPTEKPRTDFAELKVPFTAKNGIVNTSGTSLASPLIRVLATGDVDLPKEELDLRVEPKFVATLTGQGDTKARSGIMVPVNITGSFESPKIRPDLKSMLGSGSGANVKEQLKTVIGDEKTREQTIESVKKELESGKENVKEQIKGLLPGLIK